MKLGGCLPSSVTYLESKYEYDVYNINVKQFMEKSVNAVMDGSVVSCAIY